MSSITRFLPSTIEERFEALGLAKNKRDNLPIIVSNPLTTATNTRLTNTWTDLTTKMTAIATAKAAYNTGTPVKNAAGDIVRLYISHFIQVFNFGVARGKYPAGNRSFYNLPVDYVSLPDLSKDSDLIEWANYLVGGDVLRLAAGGLPMENPTPFELDTAKTNFTTLFTSQSNNKDALDTAQETLEAFLSEADKTIKKVWDELEAFFNEETDESRRENMREWGVVYITVGESKVLSGVVTYNALPGAGLRVRLKSGRNESICNATGGYSLSTTLMGEQKVIIEKLEEDTVTKQWEFTVTLNETGNLTANFTVAD